MRLPIDLAEYILKNKLVKAFGVYACLNTGYSGKVKREAAVTYLSSFKGCKDKGTVDKWLGVLLEKDWVGFNAESGYLFIRSIERVQELCRLDGGKTVSFKKEDCNNVRAFLSAAVLAGKVNSMAYAKRKEESKRFAVKQRDAARHNLTAAPSVGYLGLSKPTVAGLLGCSNTRAVQLKQAAEHAGYIKANKHYETLFVANTGDANLRAHVFNAYPHLKNRIRFNTLPSGKIEVKKQLHDEIIPQLRVRRANW